MNTFLRCRKNAMLAGAAVLLAFALTVNTSAVTVMAAPTAAESVSDNIVVRDSPVSGAQVGSLTDAQAVTITDSTTGDDGKTWYKITFEQNGTKTTGWVRGDLVEEVEGTGSETEKTEETGTSGEGQTGETTVEVKAGTQTVTLSDIPSDVSAAVSDRFTAATCDVDGAAIAAYQISAADDTVAADASLVDFYYVYGTDELGVSGWYIYDAANETLQRSTVNMQYSAAETEPADTSQTSADDADQANASGLDSMAKMVTGILAVVCLLLLILTIIFSTRYRRLRNYLEEDEDLYEDEDDYLEEEEDELTEAHPMPVKDFSPKKDWSVKDEPSEKADKKNKPEPEKKTEPAKPVRREKKKSKETMPEDELQARIEEQRRIALEREIPHEKVDLLDLDDLDDLDGYDAPGDSTSLEDEIKFGDDSAQEVSDSSHDELDELERILSQEIAAGRAKLAKDDEEPEYYDDEEDDLKFL